MTLKPLGLTADMIESPNLQDNALISISILSASLPFLYCKLSDDYLPDPLSCTITGITPQEVNQKGMCESEFIARINTEFSKPSTVVAGFNNIRFDDEFIRNGSLSKFLRPLTRESGRTTAVAGISSTWSEQHMIFALKASPGHPERRPRETQRSGSPALPRQTASARRGRTMPW